jgi:hypothetical protein
MIETIGWLARLNSGACCQIKNFFRGVGIDMKTPGVRTLGANIAAQSQRGGMSAPGGRRHTSTGAGVRS